jgi:hypothetical protein
MDIVSAPPLNGVTDISAALESMRFLLLGGTAPAVPGVNLHADIGSPCAAIILRDHVEPAEFTDALARAPDPAVPVADFFGNHPLRHDFAASKLNDETIAELKKCVGPISRRLEEIPFRSNAEDRSGLTMLRLAYSRNAPAKALLTPRYPLTVQYPLVGTAAGTRRQLESLADMDLLRRRHFARTHACGKCGSARLHVFEACPGCGGGDLIEETLVHHYRCGCQEPESRFRSGELLVCPKCRRELRHVGVDYGKPGKIDLCRTCGAVASEPLAHFMCMDCSTVTPAESAATTDWYDYDITDEGLSSLRQGRLPRFEMAPLLEQSTHAYSPREFRLLAAQEMRVARRLKRPFSVARISFPSIEAVRAELGPAAIDSALRLAVDKIVETMRAGDFVGTGRAMSVVIGFPGTASADLGPVEERIRRTIREAVVVPLEVTIAFAEGDAISEMFAEG